MNLVLDASAPVPCGEKPEEEKEAIARLGIILYEEALDITIYLSTGIIKLYRSKAFPLLKKHHPMPPFQARLYMLRDEFEKIITRSRGVICKPLQKEGLKFHVLGRSYLERYNVDNLGLRSEDDKEVLRVALAAANKEVTLVTTDHHFLNNLDWNRLREIYPERTQRIKIARPSELISYLKEEKTTI
ncbi:MAG: hypothetical protein QXQ57_07370 [Sulfolobales archaeon]